jgi:hypothetical protein
MLLVNKKVGNPCFLGMMSGYVAGFGILDMLISSLFSLRTDTSSMRASIRMMNALAS